MSDTQAPRASHESALSFKTTHRVALLVKGDLLAAITLTHAPEHVTVASRDPRCVAPTLRQFSDPQLARSIFRRTVSASERGGWRVFYLGQPLRG